MPSPRVSHAGNHVGSLREILARFSGGKSAALSKSLGDVTRVNPTSARTSRSFSTSTIFSKCRVKSVGGSTVLNVNVRLGSACDGFEKTFHSGDFRSSGSSTSSPVP